MIDRGPGIPHPQPPTDGGKPPTDAAEERGRGIHLIRALTEAARFESVCDEGGAVHMWKRLVWRPDAPWGPESSSGT